MLIGPGGAGGCAGDWAKVVVVDWKRERIRRDRERERQWWPVVVVGGSWRP